MKCLIFITLTSLATCAPVGEQAAPHLGRLDENDIRVKRAKEVMMFDNEQNEVKATEKRNDPSIQDEHLVDVKGSVKAIDPLPSESGPDNDNKNENIRADSVENNNNEAISAEENSEETVLGSDVENPTDLATELDGSSKIDAENYQDYLKDIKGPSYLKNYMQMLEAASYPYDDDKWGQLYDQHYIPSHSRFQRYRRSQNRQYSPILRRVIKRPRRIKRDLFYPSDGLSQEYDPYDNEYIVDPYEAYESSDNEELISLLDLLDNARAYDESNYGSYDGSGYDPYEALNNMIYEQEPAYYLPKRQAGLTFVPGIKREKSFYPYFEEPQSHFSAFVPQKRRFRDYEDEYERVMRLAAALREQGQYPENYGFQIYRRR